MLALLPPNKRKESKTMIITYYSKKGGVGKTTLLGEHVDYLASTGKKVLFVSIDDQNSIFEMFGLTNEVFGRDDNYLEYALAGNLKLDDALIPVRNNIVGIKTLNTDMISKKLTLERPFEKQFIQLFTDLRQRFDYIFVDLPPSSNRANEVLFELCDQIILIVELNKLGVNGLFNTVQYFTDVEVDFGKIKYVLPNGYSKMKSAPAVALEELVDIVNKNLPKAKVLSSFPEKAIIQTLQEKGVTVFDEDVTSLSPYQKSQKKELKALFTTLFKTIKL
jgi:chromosome partitioning protein